MPQQQEHGRPAWLAACWEGQQEEAGGWCLTSSESCYIMLFVYCNALNKISIHVILTTTSQFLVHSWPAAVPLLFSCRKQSCTVLAQA